MNKVLCIGLLLFQQITATLYLPFQRYSALKKEAKALCTNKDKFMLLYNKPQSPYATRDEKIDRLVKLQQIAQIWIKDKKLFDRALTTSHTMGIIDNAQALKLRMAVNFPQKNALQMSIILKQIQQEIDLLQS